MSKVFRERAGIIVRKRVYEGEVILFAYMWAFAVFGVAGAWTPILVFRDRPCFKIS